MAGENGNITKNHSVPTLVWSKSAKNRRQKLQRGFCGGMGFFDLLKAKRAAGQQSGSVNKPVPQTSAPANPETPMKPAGAAPAPMPEPSAQGTIMPRLAQARTCLEARDLAGAIAIYEQVLAEAGERADVLVTISGDLGMHGHVQQVVELIAPRYDAQRHGPAPGRNVLQSYLLLRNPDAAQQLLDGLFPLNRNEAAEALPGLPKAAPGVSRAE